jgi:hypothetical protein
MDGLITAAFAVGYVTLGVLLCEFARKAYQVGLARGDAPEEEAPPAPPDDPTRNPNYCWTHNAIYPACAGRHEEQK